MHFGRDAGHPARYVYRVFDEEPAEDDDEWEWTKHVVYTTPGGRKQLQVQVARDAGAVRKLRIQKVPTNGDLDKLETLLELDREQATRLIETLRVIEVLPAEGDASVHIDEQLMREVFADPHAIASAYAADPERFRSLIADDSAAGDVIALQHRRDVAARMRSWLARIIHGAAA